MWIRRGRWWMIQMGRWAGPINLGVHVCLRTPRYLDLHLPWTVITIGNIGSVEYPSWSWFSSRDARTGVKYADSDR